MESEEQGEGQSEAFGYVVDEESHEDGEAERGVRVVGCVGYEAFGQLVQGDGDGGLEADGHEGVFGDVVVVLGFEIFGVSFRIASFVHWFSRVGAGYSW